MTMPEIERLRERVRDLEAENARLRLGREGVEARLRESEDHFRHTVELNPQVSWTADPQGNIVSYSQRWLDLTGQAPGEPDGAGWIKAVHPDDVPHTMAVFSTCLASGDPVDVDYRIHVAAAGTYRRMRARAYPRRDAAGGIVRWYGLVEDVHEARCAADSLRASEARFRTFAQAVPNHVWSALPDGRLEWANDVTYAYSGGSPDRTIGDSWAERVHPDDQPRVAARWRASLASGETYETEFRVRRADGAYRWFLVRALPIRGPDGAIERWIGANTDIDGQRAASEELARLNATLEGEVEARTRERDLLWRNTQDIQVVLDDAGTFRSINPAFTTILGWSAADVVGRPVFDFVISEDERLTEDALRHARSAALPTVENRYRHKEGGFRWISWVASPEGDLIYASGRHVTAEKERQAELAQAQEALRQAQKMEAVGQLTGGLAHDFNNLLAGISGSLELLSTRIAQGRLNDVERYLTAAQGASKRAAALTHRLLAFSRRQTLDPKPSDVNRLVAGMEELVRRTMGPAIAVEAVAAAGLWPTLVDPGQLENALLNLCINARDAMPDGGRLTVETGNRWMDHRAARERNLPPGQYVSLCVSDTGTGMSADVAAKAFEPFFTTKPLGQGTGLGLSMIYGFAQQSGGQVRIYSELGQGTMVCLYLPRHLGPAEEAQAHPELASAPRAGTDETVLVVDDEPTVRMLVTEVLEELGYAAIEAADGPSGLKVLRSDVRIDLLVSDVGLPGGMNGRQMADAARVGRPDLKVLFITGYAENAVVGNGHLDPGMHVMTKPFAMEALASRIRELIAAPGPMPPGG